jgi:hypothetical protein
MRVLDFVKPFSLDRRAFFRHAAFSAVTLSPFSSLVRAMSRAKAPRVLRLGFAAGTAPRARRLGFDMGVAEARRSATLFGGSIVVTEIREHGEGNVDVIVGGSTREECVALASLAARRHAIFFNVGCADDALRGAACQPTMFHVAPSDAMLHDAVSLADVNGTATAWDAGLEKFGADTLNDRYKVATGKPMDADAWLAWMAVKIAWEASLRAPSTDGTALATHLRRDSTQFDGHKGRPLSFRAWDRQLRQPVYVVTSGANRQLIEEPTASGDITSRALLDRLGTSEAHTTCRRP